MQPSETGQRRGLINSQKAEQVSSYPLGEAMAVGGLAPSCAHMNVVLLSRIGPGFGTRFFPRQEAAGGTEIRSLVVEGSMICRR